MTRFAPDGRNDAADPCARMTLARTMKKSSPTDSTKYRAALADRDLHGAATRAASDKTEIRNAPLANHER
ncbi:MULTISPECIES: hypothetical protein [Burkholderia]|uniref:hypothetical protein n=1 Tax=Burkholderia TaxID=32008 RepID=UPI000F080669|nr:MULTISPECIES: hypothetical protein [Burkholderia]AYQ40736.1 hypothetical protein CVS37_21930 [Burkholderia lata]